MKKEGFNPSLRRTCHGCSHEAAIPCSERGLHLPSNDLACTNCIRNPALNRLKDNFKSIDKIKKEIIKTLPWNREILKS